MSRPKRQSVSRRGFLIAMAATSAAVGALACSDVQSGTATAAARSTSKDDSTMHQTPPEATPLPVKGTLPSLEGATGWLNSPPLTPHGVRGKVVLVEFLTYTCINWIRTLPYVRAWSEKYRDHGLVVIGVHTPEFEFEKDVENVRWAVNTMRIAFPVAIDSNYGVWRAFKNNYWPALYFVDAMGRIRHHRFGEGEYDRSETVIQQLLAEAGQGGFAPGLVSVQGAGIEAAPDWASLRSPENYVGSQRTERFASPSGLVSGRRHVYSVPASLGANAWALSGDWTAERQSVALNEPGGRIANRFRARDLHLVMGPATRGTAVRYRVLLDGQAPGPAHGVDVDEQGNGTVDEQRMYQLIRQPAPIVDHLFEIEFLDPGVEAFAFTFG